MRNTFISNDIGTEQDVSREEPERCKEEGQKERERGQEVKMEALGVSSAGKGAYHQDAHCEFKPWGPHCGSRKSTTHMHSLKRGGGSHRSKKDHDSCGPQWSQLLCERGQG